MEKMNKEKEEVNESDLPFGRKFDKNMISVLFIDPVSKQSMWLDYNRVDFLEDVDNAMLDLTNIMKSTIHGVKCFYETVVEFEKNKKEVK